MWPPMPDESSVRSASVRPTLVYVGAFMLNFTPHEMTHALTARLFGFHSMLHHLWVTPDAANASPGQVATIALSGQAFSATLAAACLLLFRAFRRRPAGLWLLFTGTTGFYIVFGNMTSAAFFGDINVALVALGTPPPIRYAISACGIVLLSLTTFHAGGALVAWAPQRFGRASAVATTTLLPWIAGTAIATMLYLPMPAFLLWPNIAASVFWAFAVAGAWWRRRGESMSIARPILIGDVVLLAVALAMVRWLAPGVRL
jgi:hypothetical protein